jgi:hypothetical protein
VAVPEIFRTIEQSGISKWIRLTDSPFGFYFILLFHTFGLATLVGANAIVDLRVLGVASAHPIKPMKQLFGYMWAGLGINIVTGILLLTAYPTKAFTNWDFYLKMLFVTLGVVAMYGLYSRSFRDSTLSESEIMERGRTIAKVSLFFWIAAIAAGRLLSETYVYITYGRLR